MPTGEDGCLRASVEVITVRVLRGPHEIFDWVVQPEPKQRPAALLAAMPMPARFRSWHRALRGTEFTAPSVALEIPSSRGMPQAVQVLWIAHGWFNSHIILVDVAGHRFAFATPDWVVELWNERGSSWQP